ncbi:hypothetical protein CEXT_354141 [Caerostris extrusa]|uniref:Uncharacterized protein n=1 Tax=Caerostris extrusa TaxID=172846 RepID=A0AAV4Y262_CAEEX|nr:hypothetical protein CEXT_354141 [Caerostris extrusa]
MRPRTWIPPASVPGGPWQERFSNEGTLLQRVLEPTLENYLFFESCSRAATLMDRVHKYSSALLRTCDSPTWETTSLHIEECSKDQNCNMHIYRKFLPPPYIPRN